MRLVVALAISGSAILAMQQWRFFGQAEAAPLAPSSTPAISSRPDNVPLNRHAGADIATAWHAGLGLRTGCMYDNGAPLDDENHPASQFSDTAGELPSFIAATADDFIIPAGTCGSLGAVQVTTIRAAFRFFNTGSEGATPLTTFNGIYVSVYPDSSNLPAGHPTDPPSPTPGQPMSQTGSVVAFQFIPVSALTNQTLLAGCSGIYQIDIPVQFSVLKGTKYWLSLVPKFAATPQSAWALSGTGGNLQAVQGLPEAGVPFWTQIGGNSGTCPNAPVAGTKRDVSFILMGDETDGSATGACCTEDTASCTDGAQQINCQLLNQTFHAGQMCSALNPPCGSGTGACCISSNHTCSVVTQSQCTSMGGTFTTGQPCSPATCPGPSNDLCADALLVSAAVTLFDTTGAFTDGPDETPACPAVNQDIWYAYNAICDGTLTVDLCTGTNFDASLAVYDGCSCPPTTRLGCDDNSCGGVAPKLTIPVTNAHCYLIRIGGTGTAVGSGQMSISCTPVSGCCQGDANGDGVINDADVQVLADAILNNPAVATPEFCRADVNGDTRVDGLDVGPFIQKLLAGTACELTGACCLADHTCSTVTQSQCASAGGTFTSGQPCSPVTCPPPANDLCANAIVLTTTSTVFDTRRATTDGNVEAGCPEINQDIWYRYTATCSGTLQIDLCQNTNFDATLAVYQGCTCPGVFLACDDDSCGTPNGPPKVSVQVTSGTCYQIRIGGKATATGTGTMALECIPTATGACCHSNVVCEVTTAANCVAAGDVFTPGVACSAVTCGPPPGNGCAGDMNHDCTIDDSDLVLFVHALVGDAANPPDTCSADVNGDGSADGLDIAPFITRYLAGGSCCCRGDVNHDGLINGLDISYFVNAMLSAADPCSAAFRGADIDGNNILDMADLDAFVTLLLTPNPTCPP